MLGVRQQAWSELGCRLRIFPWEPKQSQRRQQHVALVLMREMSIPRSLAIRTRVGSRCYRHFVMGARGIHTTSGDEQASSQPTDGHSVAGDLATPTPTRTPAPAGAGVAVGTRVRLRHTGQLGTVVGRKKGGWWVVDVLGSTGSGNGRHIDGISYPRGNDASRPLSGYISTRRINIEPLGDAYSPSDPRVSEMPMTSSFGEQGENRSGELSSKTTVSRHGRASGTGANAEDVESGTPSPIFGSQSIAAEKSTEEPCVIQYIASDGLPHDAMKEWLVFSDLHVSPSSLAVCLEALDRVNEEAMKRSDCGIVFLGDFWHTRGSLKVDLLVPVMERLSTWTRPIVMIPGNHDQVTLGGEMHALTPLQFAFADPKQAIVISQPSLFSGALWIPHVRNNAAMEAVLATDEARSARAIFCHVDVKGAAMNDGVSSQAGIPRSAFPDGVSVLSGHFHKPHALGGGFIRYVGSPYQTSLAESGQSKAFLVLHDGTWEEKTRVPISIGRRFFRVMGEDQPLPVADEVLPGDRVVWTVKGAGSEDVRRRAEALLKMKVEVEIREAPKPLLADPQGQFGTQSALGAVTAGRAGAGGFAGGTTLPDLASLSPDALFRSYLEREKNGSGTVPEEVEELGFQLIKDFGQAPPKVSRREDHCSALELHSIQLKNFGPFRDEVIYPLDGRGVVLLRGRNMDDSGADSNGSGKTTLAMSALWALTGVADARPVSDGRVSDVVHEGSVQPPSASAQEAPAPGEGDAAPNPEGKPEGRSGVGNGARRSTVAEATVTGTLNGKPLRLKRRKGTRVNQLFLEYGGEDLTRQVARETQAVLEEELGLSHHVLVRGVFQGQHHLNGLLESTDAQFKEELALLIPLDMWQDLASRSRATARKCDEDALRFRERAITRSEDLDRLSEELGRAREDLERRTADRLASAGSPPSSSLVSVATVPVSEAVDGHGVDVYRDGRVGVVSAGRSAEGVARARGGIEAGKASGDAKLESGTREGSTERARREARAAREDAEAADKALQSLRREAEELVEAWTNERMRLLGEAKAAEERKAFVRRDVEQAEAVLREAEAAASGFDRESVELREKYPELWEEFRGNRTGDEGRSKQQMVLSSEVQEAEARLASSRAALAEAKAALRHASEALQAHKELEMVGEGECYTCGQPVTGKIVRDRGEMLSVAERAAVEKTRLCEMEALQSQKLLDTARSRASRWRELARFKEGAAAARQRVEQDAEDVEARRAELRLTEDASAKVEAEAAVVNERETLLRREWAGKTRAAEWALKAYRDKQILADKELTDALALEAELQLEYQKQEAEMQRLLDAEAVAEAKVKEIEVAVERIRDELADLGEKERAASGLKATHTALAEHLGVRGVQNFVFRDAVNQLQANVARYLDVLSDGALQLFLSMEGDRVVKRASARAADGSFRDRSLSQLSGGQWRRCSLALELAFAELTRQRSRFSCNVLVLDEVLSQLDSHGRARVADMLRVLAHGYAVEDESGASVTKPMYSTIVVILQDASAEEIQDSFDRIDQVVKHRDASRVVVDGYS